MGSFSMGWDALRDPSCLAESMEVPARAGIPEKNPALSHSCMPSISNQAVKTFQQNTRNSSQGKETGNQRRRRQHSTRAVPPWWHRGDSPR